MLQDFLFIIILFFGDPEMKLMASSTTGKLSITEPHPGPALRRFYFYFIFTVLLYGTQSPGKEGCVPCHYALNPISEFLTVQSLLDI